MSFMDPDYREKLAKVAEAQAALCKTEGHQISGDRCTRCTFVSSTPRVVLQSADYRAVFLPSNHKIVFEIKSTDTLGKERWDKVADLGSSYAKGEPNLYHIYQLLVYGKVP
jgi:hypothetical protein